MPVTGSKLVDAALNVILPVLEEIVAVGAADNVTTFPEIEVTVGTGLVTIPVPETCIPTAIPAVDATVIVEAAVLPVAVVIAFLSIGIVKFCPFATEKADAPVTTELTIVNSVGVVALSAVIVRVKPPATGTVKVVEEPFCVGVTPFAVKTAAGIV